MARPHEQPVADGYRNPADACLARTADAVDFTSPSSAEVTAAAERRVDPVRRVLAELFRGLRAR
jgi:hypothetical protein